MFLHRVVEGPSDRSYGIHVAQLAGVPAVVCERAEQILANLEQHELNVTGDSALLDPIVAHGDRINQLDLFRPAAEEIADRLRQLDTDILTPIEALNALSEFKRRVTGDD